VIRFAAVRRLETLAADSRTLQAYLREIAKFPRLTREQEHEFGRRIQQRGDRQAIEALVESNLRFVVSYAKRYRNLGAPCLDLIREGNLGLIEAARRFDPVRNIRFITYGMWWVRQSIMHVLSDSSSLYAVPSKVSRAAASFAREMVVLLAHAEHGSWRRALDDEPDLSLDEAELLLPVEADDLSLSRGAWVHDTAREGVELLEMLQDHTVDQIDDLTRDALIEEIESVMGELDPRERQVLRLHYGLHDDDPWTLQQIADHLHLSCDRIRQIESRAMLKVRRRKNLRSYLN